MRDRLVGLLLFLPVPIVLVLFTRQPLGPWPSLGLGVLLVASHRLYARPFALRRAARRCLWCGTAANGGQPLTVDEPSGRTVWRLCGAPHLRLATATLGWAAAHGRGLAAGILGSLGLFLALAAASAGGWRVNMADAVALFRLGVAVTVLPLGWLGPSRGARQGNGEPPRLPFPVHIQALIGTVAVLWLFRLVGLWWLVASLAHLARRLA